MFKKKKELAVTKAAVNPSAAYQAKVIADGAFAYWPLDESSGTVARDLAGSRNGTITAGVTLGVLGARAGLKAMSFDGIGKINLPTIPSISTGHTFEGWIFFNRGADFETGYIICRPTFTIGGFDFQQIGHSTVASWIRMSYRTVINAEGPQNLTYGVWRYIVSTFDGANIRIYINGILYSAVIPTSFTDVATSTPLVIGWSDTNAKACILQDVAIYMRALTPAEISSHYALRP